MFMIRIPNIYKQNKKKTKCKQSENIYSIKEIIMEIPKFHKLYQKTKYKILFL